MAVVIPFAPRRRRSARPRAAEPRDAAQILFFTGIRYERHGEPQPPADGTRRSRRDGERAKLAGKSARQPA